MATSKKVITYTARALIALEELAVARLTDEIHLAAIERLEQQIACKAVHDMGGTPFLLAFDYEPDFYEATQSVAITIKATVMPKFF
jgi:hypothetical protein